MGFAEGRGLLLAGGIGTEKENRGYLYELVRPHRRVGRDCKASCVLWYYTLHIQNGQLFSSPLAW